MTATILLIWFAIISVALFGLAIAQDRCITRLFALLEQSRKARMDAMLGYERAYTDLLQTIDPAAAEKTRRDLARIHADSALQFCMTERK